MRSCTVPELLVTGLGVTTAVGQGKAAFVEALMVGRHAFRIMQRPGRQRDSAYIGAEIEALAFPEGIGKRLQRSASFTAQTALVTLLEAWAEAGLATCDPRRIGLVVGGSNVTQREQLLTYAKYADKPTFISPTYGLTFMDSDICGLCTEQVGIQGAAHTAGGASASGQLALIQAAQAVQSGQLDACIALGVVMDVSYLELGAFQALGALGSERYGQAPELACRPFDRGRDGFIFGEGCAAIVIENADSVARRQVRPYARLAGYAVAMDGNRNPNPSLDGEMSAIRSALSAAGVSPQEIDYINPHGSGSLVGDEIELQAIRGCGLDHAYINTTKSITGHGLTAAGAIEAAALLLQMRQSQLHPSRNLDDPIDAGMNWVRGQSVAHRVRHACNLSLGFGGINTAAVFSYV